MDKFPEEAPIPAPSESLPPQIPNAQSFFKKNQILILLGAVIIILLILGAILLFLPKNNRVVENSQNEIALSNQTQTLKTSSPPKLEFDSYVYQNKQDITQTVGDSSTYNLKTSFSEQDASSLAAKFGLSKISTKGNNFIAEDTTDPNTASTLGLNKNTGAIFAEFRGDQKSIGYIPGQSYQQTALQVINELGLSYPVINCPVTYQISNQPDVTYVECHKNWGAIGPQLINYIAVMSLPLNIKIGSFIPGDVAPNTPTDISIVNVSNGQNNKARPNGYNTITIGIRNDGTISAIDSNLRWVEPTKNVITNTALLTEAQAISLAQKGKAPLELSHSNATIDRSKIYPGNVARAKIAIIDEILLVYLENSPQNKQSSYQPYYLIRGTANLDSGYAIKYEQVLPAQKYKYNPSDIPSTELAQAEIMSSENRQIQLGALTPTPPIVPYVEETVPPTLLDMCTQEGIDYEASRHNMDRQESEGAYGPYKINVPGYGNVNLVWNYVRGGIFIETLTNGKPINSGVVRAAAWEQTGEYLFRDLGPVPPGMAMGCMVRLIAPVTPELFLYPEKRTKISINLLSPLLYTNPATINNSWEVTAEPNGNISNSQFGKISYLYYEYDANNTSFSQPTQGYIVKRSEIKNLVEDVSKKLKLNETETNRLILDVEGVTKRYTTSHLRVSLVNQSVINKQLPLKINPQPETFYRVNLNISQSDGNESIPAPEIKPIVRSGYTVIEIGASIGVDK